ncbi:16856_t:CDS:10, partial [Rhizophagus irregularis]
MNYSIEEINDMKYIRFLDGKLLSIMQSYFPYEDLFRNALPARNLLSILNNLKNNHGPYFPDLINWVEEQYKDEIKLIQIITNNGFIEFKNLAQLFPIVINSDGYSFIYEKYYTFIDFWKGLCKINKLPIIPLSKEDNIYNKLVARGKKFIKYAIGHHFLQHSHSSKYSKGRIMVDISNYKNYSLASSIFNNNCYLEYLEDIKINDDVKEEELFMCVSKLPAYSFTWKDWHFIDVEHLNAFDKLVLDQEKKSIIENIIKFEYSKTDIINSKGDGYTFLLHGPSGVGKTLTVEAISEKLHHPLYSISTGELGTNAKDLENNLRNIFNLAYYWNAIILIDEVNHNALVCVFLRLLEYHQGIVFLTTNRVYCFDDTFQFHISISLEYKEPDIKDYNPNNVNIKKLSDIHLNGREIQNTVKLASTLNRELITTELLEKFINLTSKKILVSSAD